MASYQELLFKKEKMAKERNLYPMTEPLIAIHSVSDALKYDTSCQSDRL